VFRLCTDGRAGQTRTTPAKSTIIAHIFIGCHTQGCLLEGRQDLCRI
jgi:hypothetical protein